jgi:hypothetical protein
VEIRMFIINLVLNLSGRLKKIRSRVADAPSELIFVKILKPVAFFPNVGGEQIN